MANDYTDLISVGEKNELKNILNTGNVDECIEKLISASFEEYVQMILGKKVFTRGSDIREYRLFLLIKYYFKGNVPNEQKISDFFQTTPSESRSLLRTVLSKYQYELRESLNDTIKEYLINPQLISANIKRNTPNVCIINIGQSIVDEMNRILSKQSGDIILFTKKSRSANTYQAPKSSYIKICDFLDIESEKRIEWKKDE